MSAACPDPKNLVGETLVLSLNLVGVDVGGQHYIARALRKHQREIEREIEKALRSETRKLLNLQMRGPVSDERALKSFATVGQAISSAISSYPEQKLGRWAECTWNHSPLGVWVDGVKTIYLIVPLVIAASGAAAYAYRVRSGDTLAAQSALYVKKHLKVKPIGTLELGFEEITFVPSDRNVSVQFFGEMDWKPFKAKLIVGAGLQEGKLSTWNASGDLSYKGIGAASNIELSFKPFARQADNELSFGGVGAAKYRTQFHGIPVSAGLQAEWKRTRDAERQIRGQESLMLTVSLFEY
jgi:hypothetical protein